MPIMKDSEKQPLIELKSTPVCPHCGGSLDDSIIKTLLYKAKWNDYSPELYTCVNPICGYLYLVSLNHEMIEFKDSNDPIQVDGLNFDNFFKGLREAKPEGNKGEKQQTEEIKPPETHTQIANKAMVETAMVTEKKEDDWQAIESFLNLSINTMKQATRIRLAHNITEIPNKAFQNCDRLREIILPQELKRIGSHSFEGCISLRHVDIPSTVIDIAEYAFKDCSNLDSVSLPCQTDLGCGALTEIRSHVFENSGLRSVFIPQNIKVIGEYAFAASTRLISLHCSLNSVKQILDYAFAGCSELLSLGNDALGKELLNIGRFAFSDCTALRDVDIPANVSSIGDHAFSGCTSLRILVLPSGISDLHKNSFGMNKEHMVKNPPFRMNVLANSDTYQQIKKYCSWCMKFREEF